MMKHIAIVEDDTSIAEMLSFHMSAQGYEVTHFEDGEVARQKLLSNSYDIVLLDIMLPNCNGLDICKELRQKNPSIPILMLTSLDGEADRVIGLELGADDYLTKPFSMRECTARVKALLRRSQLLAPVEVVDEAPNEDKLTIAELTLTASSRVVCFNKQEVDFTAREFDLLYYLAQNAGRVYSRSQLLDAIWGYSHDGYEHTINTHINRLRNKLKRDNGKSEFIQTVWGVGYKFVQPDEDEA
ncbi:response regulator transcription factor [Leucothrix sargassi]|nr:response regulator transcription factor [Leucothrix sargassi]